MEARPYSDSMLYNLDMECSRNGILASMGRSMENTTQKVEQQNRGIRNASEFSGGNVMNDKEKVPTLHQENKRLKSPNGEHKKTNSCPSVISCEKSPSEQEHEKLKCQFYGGNETAFARPQSAYMFYEEKNPTLEQENEIRHYCGHEFEPVLLNPSNLPSVDENERLKSALWGLSDVRETVCMCSSLKKIYKEKIQALEQEMKRLKCQLDGKCQTANMWQYAAQENIDLRHQKQRRDLEENLRFLKRRVYSLSEENRQLKGEKISIIQIQQKLEEISNEKIRRLEMDKQSLDEQMCRLKKKVQRKLLDENHEKTMLQSKINTLKMENNSLVENNAELMQWKKSMENMVSESKKEKTAMMETNQKLQEDKQMLDQRITEIQQELKDSIENMVRDRKKEKTSLVGIIQKLRQEKQLLDKKHTEIQQELKDSTENIKRCGQEQKTMGETIKRLQDENQTQAKKISAFELKAGQQAAELEAVKNQIKKATDEQETARTQFNNLQRRNAALYHLIDQFKRGLQASEDRAQASEDRAQASEDRAQALRDSLREIINPLELLRRLRAARDMLILRAEYQADAPG